MMAAQALLQPSVEVPFPNRLVCIGAIRVSLRGWAPFKAPLAQAQGLALGLLQVAPASGVVMDRFFIDSRQSVVLLQHIRYCFPIRF